MGALKLIDGKGRHLDVARPARPCDRAVRRDVAIRAAMSGGRVVDLEFERMRRRPVFGLVPGGEAA